MPTRIIHHADALIWLATQGPISGASFITSLPDVSELPDLGFDGWRDWFEAAAGAVLDHLTDEGVAIFFQSDIRHAGFWVDKGALVARAAERAKVGLVFHQVVCRKPAGTATMGRASYAHLLGFSRTPRPPRRATVDVLPDGGAKPGTKSMGVTACRAACQYVLAETSTRTIIDPFCGFGTVLAVANSLGLDAIGVDLSIRMCRKARALELSLDGAPR